MIRKHRGCVRHRDEKNFETKKKCVRPETKTHDTDSNSHRAHAENIHRTLPTYKQITYAVNEQRTAIMLALMLEAAYEQ